MEKLHQEFGEKLLVIGANGFGDSQQKIEEFAKENQLTYPLVPDAAEIAREQFFVTGYPTTFWIDADGKIVKRMTGFDESDFSKLRDELIRQMASSAKSRD